MINESRRGFFKTVLGAGAALAVTGNVASPGRAEAATRNGVKGVCLFVPTLGKAADFVEMMNNSAPGDWSVHPIEGTLTESYFRTKSLYEEAKAKANTFVGVVDPATFAVIHEAVVDSGGSFHYVTYEESNRVTFSALL